MKTVRVKNGVVAEIIPEYALPVEQWYGANFAAQCVEAPDEVKQNWTYDGEIFAPPVESEPTEPAPDLTPQIQVAMMAFAATSTAIPDDYALDMPDLFPVWENLLAAGKPLTKGTILREGEQLYRVNQESVTPQAHQPPSGVGMTAVYVPINRSNSGTLDDPIPAVRGMDYIVGKYYLDPEDSKVYLCKRLGEEDGSVITLQYLPHELIDQYFVTV